MKALLCLGLILFGARLGATPLLVEDFNGASLNTNLWQTILPFGQSSVVQSGGAVTTTARGYLATVNGFSSPYVITGEFTMLNAFEHFDISFRTDLSPLPDADLFHQLSGIFVSFSNDGDQISIQGRGFSPQFSTPADHKNYTLTTGQKYSFSIFDDGYNIAVGINGVTELTASTLNSTGNHVAFSSREFGFTSTALDSVAINGVPDAGSCGVMMGVLFLCMAAVYHKAERKRSGSNF